MEERVSGGRRVRGCVVITQKWPAPDSLTGAGRTDLLVAPARRSAIRAPLMAMIEDICEAAGRWVVRG